MQHRLLVDVIVRPEYIVRYEQADDVTFVHVSVHQWDARVARQFHDDIEIAHKMLGRPVYALDNPGHPNLPKFLRMHGFHPCGHVTDAHGRVVAIYEKSLDGQCIRRWFPENHPDS